MCLELSSYGKGDIREPFVCITHADGATTSDFVFESATITKGKEPFATLPGSHGSEEQVEHLTILLKDRTYHTELELHYYVYEKCDVITRSAILKNSTEETIRVDRLLSNQIDFDKSPFVITSFHGAWAREFDKNETLLTAGKYAISSMTGTTSNRANPLLILRPQTTSEEQEIVMA